MTPYDRVTELRARMKVAAEVEANDKLLGRARDVQTQLDDACRFVEAVVKFRAEAQSGNSAPVDSGGLRQAVDGFRSALSNDGSAALQQQFAATMLQELGKLRQVLQRVTRSDWRSLFSDVTPLLELEAVGVGSSAASRRRAATPARRLRTAFGLDPVENLAELERLFSVRGMSASVDAIAETAEELRVALEALDRETQELAPEVRILLEQADSDKGFPLAELTPQLIDDLRAAGVLDSLFIRRS